MARQPSFPPPEAGLDEALQRGLEGGALLFTTNPGLEDLAAGELCERLAPLGLAAPQVRLQLKPWGFGGHLLVLLPQVDSGVTEAALAMGTVHHVLHPLYGFDLPADPAAGLDHIHAQLSERGVPALGEDGVASFRVTTRRNGEHPFSSIDVQRRAGAALHERYRVAVDLTGFDREVRVDVRGQRCLVSVQLTRDPLSGRQLRLYNPGAALKANVACALLRLAGVERGRLLDPFCGSATILIEAARLHPGLEIEASDYSPRAVEGSGRNLEAEGLAGRVALTCRDMSDLPDAHPAGRFDVIVTNPPFGVRLGRGMNFSVFYSRFLDVAAHLLRPGGRLVFLAWKRGLIDKANRPARRFRRLHVRVVETGGIYPRIYVMERRRDPGPGEAGPG